MLDCRNCSTSGFLRKPWQVPDGNSTLAIRFGSPWLTKTTTTRLWPVRQSMSYVPCPNALTRSKRGCSVSRKLATNNAAPIRSWCFRLRRNRCGAAVLLSLVFLCLPAGSQHPAKICVTFHSRVHLYTPSTAVEQQVSGRLAKACVTQIGYWNFSAGSNADLPQLKVELTTDANGNHQLLSSLIIESGAQPIATWPQPLFKPGDFTRLAVLPKYDELPDMVGFVFEQDLLPRHTAEIRQTLMESVPLGKDVVLMINS